jgi:predicted GNAT superfamily acetyltransferase
MRRLAFDREADLDSWDLVWHGERYDGLLYVERAASGGCSALNSVSVRRINSITL